MNEFGDTPRSARQRRKHSRHLLHKCLAPAFDGGANQLAGGKGDDRLVGAAGDDRLEGGEGADRLEGGEGSDSFVFKDRWGDDAIIDFADGHDAIQLDAPAYAQLDQALENAVQNGADAVLAFDGGTITLANTNIANITHDDFRLAG
jgi:Ca2+-binding RTX toxin-like protein